MKRLEPIEKRERAGLVQSLKRAFWPGILGGLAIVPYGMVLLFWLHAHVDVYGTKTLQLLVAKPTPLLEFVQHMVISYAFAIPYVWALEQMRSWHNRSRTFHLLLGAAYGLLIWSAVNSLMLPVLFHDKTPWQLGWYAIWPSLTGHVVYGIVVALLARRQLRLVQATKVRASEV
ncbi:MAG: hypothetical protein A2201_04540 [Alicyclobacillus sp. RIFOXYA1_FULL_53_8]|nr:MAG: hypothetical protein A2201_04540 [Alicyclobacillus sp. RIFOXYA1_FULL_53_8]